MLPPPLAPDAPPQPVLVLGMHRSGTSALTRVVNLLGADVPANLWPANDGNERGYWESRDLTAIQDELMTAVGSDWDQVVRVPAAAFAGDVAAGCEARALAVLRRDLAGSRTFVLKDPRMSLLVPFWTATLARFTAAEPVFLVAVRNPLEVAASLAKRNGFRPQKSMLLWLRHTLEAERATRGRRRCLVSYDAVLADWRGVAARAGRLLGVAWPRSVEEAGPAVDAELTADLRHTRATAADVAADPAVPPWVRAVYPALVAAADDPDGRVDVDVLDRVRAAFDDADVAYGPLMAEHHEATWAAWNLRAAAGLTAAELAARPTADDVGRLTGEVARLTADAGRLAGEVGRLQDEVRAHGAERRLLDAAVAGQLAAAREAVGRADDRERAATAERDRLRLRVDAARREADEARRPPAVPVVDPPPADAPPADASPPALAVPRLSVFHRPRLTAAQWEEVRLIRESGLFDVASYRRQAVDLGAGDPVVHYVRVGAAAGLHPHPLFDPTFYASQLEAGAGAAASPLADYLGPGWRAGREPNWLFDGRYYARSNPAAAAVPGFNPLAHFAAVGWRQGRNPHPLFDVDFYLAANPDVAAVGADPLGHYLTCGLRERRSPNRLFDFDYYDHHNPDVKAAGMDPLGHFITYGWREGRNPGPAFDVAAYRLFAADLPVAGGEPLGHYLQFGNAGDVPPFGDDRRVDARSRRPAPAE